MRCSFGIAIATSCDARTRPLAFSFAPSGEPTVQVAKRP